MAVKTKPINKDCIEDAEGHLNTPDIRFFSRNPRGQEKMAEFHSRALKKEIVHREYCT